MLSNLVLLLGVVQLIAGRQCIILLLRATVDDISWVL